jgi:transposase InsO family protein
LLIIIGACGKPGRIRTDNEAVFTSHVFKAALGALGIRHQTTELACPWKNGRIERLFGTLKQTLNSFKINSRGELQGLLHCFSFWYNAIRPHQNLNDRTPLGA